MILRLVSAAILLACGIVIGRYELAPFAALNSLKSLLFETSTGQGPDPHYVARQGLFSLLTGRADIVMLGDSLTEYTEWPELFPGSSILNRGIAGDTADGLLSRLDDVIALRPRLVFLMIGVNNFRRGDPVSVVARDIRLAISRMRAHRIDVIVQSTLFTYDHARMNKQIAELNDAIRAWCRDNDTPYVDLNALLAPEGRLEGGYTTDGIHLNGRAYIRWRDAILPIATQRNRQQL